jgi:hypothetical protein
VTTLSRDGDVVTVALGPQESTLLAGLALSLVELLAPDPAATAAAAATSDPLAALVGMAEGPVAVPDDPALRRLLPDAYADAEGAEEFRRLTDGSLRQGKVAALTRIADDVAAATDGRVLLGPDEADAWLTGLNDIRLVLGVRLDVTEDRSELDDLDDDDPRTMLLAAYDWLTYLQEMLVALVTGDR